MPRLPFRRCLVATVLLACCGLGGSTAAWACSIDQTPSVSVDGRLARLNKQMPTSQAQMATWSTFIFAGHYSAHRAIVLSEDRRELARTLTAQALRQPCGWQFGDGQVAYGWTVRHAYARPGRWPIRVYVWDPQSGRWDLFDQVTISIG